MKPVHVSERAFLLFEDLKIYDLMMDRRGWMMMHNQLEMNILNVENMTNYSMRGFQKNTACLFI